MYRHWGPGERTLSGKMPGSSLREKCQHKESVPWAVVFRTHEVGPVGGQYTYHVGPRLGSRQTPDVRLRRRHLRIDRRDGKEVRERVFVTRSVRVGGVCSDLRSNHGE